jgi:BCD family chlorophyll transporter-like MFS transporter
MGYNFAAVSYLSLASEVSGPGTKGCTLAVMWSLMICGIIATSMILGRLLAPYSEQVLARSFLLVAAVALLIGCAAVLRLEEPEGRGAGTGRARAAHEGAQARSWRQLLGRVLKNPQAVLFLVYLTVLLSAIFGQDLLLEPFAGEALDIPVSGTTRLTAIWGACFLVSMALGSALERRVAKKRMAAFGAGVALTALLVLVGAGYLQSRGLFYAGTVLLGLGSGLSTLANLSLMLDMILPGSEGLYMGLWGIASAVSRVAGAASGAVLRDLLGASRPLTGYAAAFFLLAGFLVVSLVLLPRIDVARFQARARASLRSPDARVFEALD